MALSIPLDHPSFMVTPKHIVGIYIRLATTELTRLREHPEILPKYDPRVALDDGRAVDIGRAWEELGVFIDGGVKLPTRGPIVGDTELPHTDERATWSYIEAPRVQEIADYLVNIRRNEEFKKHYDHDPDDTADSLPGSRTAGWGDRGTYMLGKLRILAAHYALAAKNGEGMLVRIGERI
ncbi:DUF1877 family protein [Desulfobulbus sp. AH-315-M07]|nr:DUF1877 family protein [Desulfobulbus sp. AH-315-M07]